ncbi:MULTISPECIES: (2Fe-2S)-binding protein [Cetobacterium]|jgi:NAD(P)H-nitrite reductase large subunit|uniref:Bacterioferritin-associated ferredoxin n=1 Tax=Candidatus Cetobacterium colombiensis TaxID=3073100 RepID=A0ABU4W6H8_9FUSO|nr:(2Fe-2S)-binding protein [Candidatus Cetobacterium colombiensis]MDX8335127.1 (2Fe-2S)-binding protein [Candidatus Cetobacterium colombiensis]
MSEDKILCYCKGVTLGKVIDAIENGATTLVEVLDATGAGSSCGRCIERIESIFEQE